MNFEIAKKEDIDNSTQIHLSYNLTNKHILVCEDHPINAELVKRLIEKKGGTVAIAGNGKECLDTFLSKPVGFFSAILMDIKMPVMNGYEATLQIRSSDHPGSKSIPIIAMTANAYDSDKDQCREVGMNAHLSKPIEPSVLYYTLATEILKRNEQGE